MLDSAGEFAHTALDVAKRKIYRGVIYPASQRGYEHMQQNIGRGIREKGLTLPQSVDRVYARMGAKFQLLPENSQTADMIRNGAGIFVGNNANPGSAFQYFRAMRDRPSDDVFFIDKDVNLPYWDETIRQHILPVYVDLHLDQMNRYFAEKAKNSTEYDRLKSLAPVERLQLNNQTLSDAAVKVADGGIVTIFPSGLSDDEDDWKRGLGEIVHQLGERRPDAQLFMGYTQGTSAWDKYRLAPGIRRIKPVSVTMHIKAVNLNSLLTGTPMDADAKTISQHLRNAYGDWVAAKKAEEKRVSVQNRQLY